MEQEGAKDFKQACEQCSEVHWGITDEGKFFCKSCHNVIEKTAEVPSEDFIQNVRISSINRGLKKKRKVDRGCQWYVCEGFQYILNQQVKALIILGASPQIKDEILCNLWRSYLQKSQQAYTNRPTGSKKKRMVSAVTSCSSGQDSPSGSSNLDDRCLFLESKSEDEVASIQSGSVDGSTYRSGAQREKLLMSMPMTLAFCYLALLWLRESITLVDLLRFAEMEHVPYLNTFQHFPAEMVLYGNDTHIFQVQAIPSYDEIQKNMHSLAVFLNLREFPAISEKCFLHPDILVIKYLMEANLPEEMHFWTRELVKQIGIGETTFLTFQPLIGGTTAINYEVQAVAVIIVALKLLFGLNDKIEWIASKEAKKISKANPEVKVFQFSKWYQVMRECLDEREDEAQEETARRPWKSEKAIFYSLNAKLVIFKRKRAANS
ncbi:TATA box-binding protein-associated factor RNA polymerase I subunit B isoform X2 [Callorhinchus milii]|uniref:TATA box-binding protein-associated factor RNA polymerase I subunit B isoform X2 n=1 Tax=Callorhinchus milii TaxID=7868 RepID=UPI0004575697|nr:TATA box-binding protein-associated factor RNA polymerase I subunit B isoform X2 [Callorhinchus milii]|eukprot:gi/632976232/ref/XP_007904680.1/ PREDICTED: TATA box-binding protein-associated factor RNA polymerase I subunit B isoform X2 [Callorhinchus milii]